ncbi:MAG: carboxypeptidase regulatory-like domain-containing protein [Planctomycetes bacterium]|nr:carboxypeptidase regulatory-like domain-containing protein [Planctomycetota bacterium]MCA8937705.1 carboxypeptidase regulatory-like domain-containing protein [Planctomycetota bacterium]
MRTNYWLLAVTIALFAGVGVGYLLAPSPQVKTTGAGTLDRNLVAENAGSALDDPVAPRKQPEKSTSSNSRPEKETSIDDPNTDRAGELLQVLQSIPASSRPRGDGVIEGVVMDGDGNPIPGAKVTAEALRDRTKKQLVRTWDDSDRELWQGLEQDITELVRNRVYHYDPAFSAVTDAGGHYRIEGLVKQATSVRVTHSKYQFEVSDGLYQHVPDAVVDFVGFSTRRVHIRLISADGNEPPPAQLRVKGLSDQVIRTPPGIQSGSDWLIDLPPGAYSISALYFYPTRIIDEQIVVVEAGDTAQEVTLNYSPSSGLQVTVQQVKLGFRQHEVWCVPDVSDADPLEVLGAARSSELLLEHLASDQPVVFAGLPEGDYVVGVKGFDRWLAAERVHYAGGAQELEFNLEPPPENECIVCTVKTPDGMPPVMPSFTITGESYRGVTPVPWPVGGMRYLLQLPPSGEFDASRPGTLMLTDHRYGSVQTDLATCMPQSVQLEFQAQGYLILQWEDDQFAPGEQPEVSLTNADGKTVHRGDFSWSQQVKNGGVITRLQPGRYHLELSPPGWGSSFVMYSADVDIGPDFNILPVPRVKLTTLDVVRTDATIRSFRLSRTLDGKVSARSFDIEADNFQIENLPPGDYTIRYRKPEESVPREVAFQVPRDSKAYLD